MRVPLAAVEEGRSVVVKGVEGLKLRSRLKELGIVVGTELRVVRNEGGPVVVDLKGERLAMGRGMAHRVYVEVRGDEV
jgi:ferrous iron transport protein A